MVRAIVLIIRLIYKIRFNIGDLDISELNGIVSHKVIAFNDFLRIRKNSNYLTLIR